MAFGSAVHAGLEALFRDPQKSEQLLLETFTKALHKRAGHFTEADLQRKLAYGQKILHEYFTHYQTTWTQPAEVELSLKSNHAGIALTGKIDKIEHHDNELCVIDYKTGRVYSDAFLRPEETEDGLGGSYWRQLAFYKLLLDTHPHWQHKHVAAGMMDYIEPQAGKFVQKKMTLTTADVAAVADQAQTVWQKIHQHQFTGCDKETCTWCQLMQQ